jgi:probable rRNA maturation factor
MTAPLVDRQVAIEADDLPTQAQLEAWAGGVLARFPGERRHELTIRFVDENESLELNHRYRDKEKPTNVLSFPFEGPPGLDLPLLGDLVICHAVVMREAFEQDKLPGDHYAHMVVHGILHLLGHDHLEDAEADAMESLERDILASLDIPDPYDREGPDVRRNDTEDKRNDA